MARRRSFVRGAAAISQKRQTVWVQLSPFVSTIAAASTAVAIFSFNAAALALRPFTIVRTRASMTMRSDQNAASERFGANFGMAVVSDQAVAIGVTAVPTPVSDLGSDLWFVMEAMYGTVQVGDATGFDGDFGFHRELDSKAMRRVDLGQDVIAVMETPSFGSSADFTFSGRMLIKLH